MKKTIWAVIVILVLAGIGYFVFSRPVVPPTAPIGELSAKLPDGTPGQSGIVYRIGTGSEARFSIYELLAGKDKTVVGTTPDIGGDIRVNDNKIEIGPISINARTLQTDSDDRDRALARFILKSTDPANELMTFKPSSVTGAPAIIPTGKEFSLSVSGDLTVSGVTHAETFVIKMTVNPDSITGTAEAKLKRSDFKLVIPNLSFIANVPDEFTVGGSIVANKIAL